MESTFSFLSYIHEVPTMSLILIFMAGFGLGGLIVDAYLSYKHRKLIEKIRPTIEKLQENLRKMRELNARYRFTELQSSIDLEPEIQQVIREAMESEDTE